MLLPNVSAEAAVSNYTYLEPVPEWTMISLHVGHGFVIFIVIGAVFLIIHVVCILLLPFLCRNHINKRYHVTELFTVSMSSLCLGICLTVDPYSRWLKLPVFLNNLLEQLSNPCMIIAFFSLQNSLLNLASIRISWNKLQSCSRLCFVFILYIGSLILFETLVLYNNHLTSPRLLSKLQFVVFSVYSCICFLCTGFKAAIYLDYVKSPNKLKTILIDNPTETEADSKSLLRHSTEKLLVLPPGSPLSGVDQMRLRSVYTSSDSSDAEISSNTKRKTRRKSASKRSTLKVGTDTVKPTKCSNNKLRPDDTCKPGTSKCDPLNSSITCMEQSVIYRNKYRKVYGTSKSDPGLSKCCITEPYETNFQTSNLSNPSATTDEHYSKSQMTTQSDVDPSDYIYQSSEDGDFILRECELRHNHISRNDDTSRATNNANVNKKLLSQDYDDDDDISYCSESPDDNGYLADGENVNVSAGKKAHSLDGDSIYSHFTDVQESTLDNYKSTSVAIPPSCSRMRVRQCTVLRKLISIAYFVTFTVVVNAIFHMYSIFGVYGIFGTHRTPKPWPWFLFQVIHRLVELILATSLLAPVTIVLWHRPRRRRPRLPKTSHE